MGLKPCQNRFLHPILVHCRKIRKNRKNLTKLRTISSTLYWGPQRPIFVKMWPSNEFEFETPSLKDPYGLKTDWSVSALFIMVLFPCSASPLYVLLFASPRRLLSRRFSTSSSHSPSSKSTRTPSSTSPTHGQRLQRSTSKNILREEGLISNKGISKAFLPQKLSRRVSRRLLTAFSKIISKMGISKNVLGTESKSKFPTLGPVCIVYCWGH